LTGTAYFTALAWSSARLELPGVQSTDFSRVVLTATAEPRSKSVLSTSCS